MNKISLHCISFIAFALVCTQVLAGSRLTFVEDTADLTLADTNPVLLGTHLLFQTTEEHGVTLWSQNTENNTRVSLQYMKGWSPSAVGVIDYTAWA